jgi:hypothetical protein
MLSNVGTSWVRLPLAAILMVAGGCASVQDMAGVPRTGHQKDGTYIVSEEDEKLACRQIHDRLETLSRQLKMLPQKAAIEQKSRPMTVTAAFGRMFGEPGDGLTATTEYQKASAETDALNALLVKKNCI